jgi:hypothetical protein
MALTGRFHPLLVNFPIALVSIAAVAELVSLTTRFPEGHMIAVANIPRRGLPSRLPPRVGPRLISHRRGVSRS